MSSGQNPAPGRAPMVLVVMGVSGSGKSTVASRLAERLGWDFVDGDSFHTPEHVAKMRAGHPLDDDDRAPWLAAIGAWIDTQLQRRASGVVVCSALRRAYRDVLVRGRAGVRIVYLEGDRAVIEGRLARRQGHFMPAGLLDTQFAILEPPGPEENAVAVGIDGAPEAIVATILARLGLGEGAPQP
ncbi:carbohydrate kinase [Methylobacterium sp. Leaf104]|uniref:gluconokinase n=1 Tax=Methylobacterium TaxID=407 RepID=UPI0006F29505|nr:MULTISPECIES: gluconokinase [Methylobacterium]KQP41371.1 carbohydrate kinase [Methylobacterium sp. Leaf104]MCI9881662.1 gluconokinase [Methylobacterium goesingense]